MVEREWDLRVVWLVKRQRWWWSAWRASTRTERYGFADSHEDALRAVTAAIEDAPTRAIPVRVHGRDQH